MSTFREPVVVVGLARTPMGAFQGVFSGVSATELGAHAIKGALDDAGISSDAVTEVLMGCVLPASLGQAPARNAALKAGIPLSVPTSTINKVCGSGKKTISLAVQLLQNNPGVIVAGGMENMSRAPHMLASSRSGYRLGHGELLDHMFVDGLQDASSGTVMGNYAESTADKFRLSRELQDTFALESLARATKASENGLFEREIAPFVISGKLGQTVVDKDEPLKLARPDKITKLKPAFKAGGTVTAANSSSIADGAAALVLMRKSEAKARGMAFLAEIVSAAEYAHEPELFTTAPIEAITRVASQSGYDLSEVDLFEINEAFAAVTLCAEHALGLDHQKVNIRGGACALGHPLGASGARILVTLISAMQKENKRTGIASLCIGGGEAIAMALSRE